MNEDFKKGLIKDAIKEFRQDELKQKKNAIFHNTQLLMKHYNELKQHSENAIYKLNQIFDQEEILNTSKQNDFKKHDIGKIEYDKIYIESILKSKIRTAIMIQHIDVALEILKANATKEDYSNKYNAMIDLYVNNKTYEELAEVYHCDTTTLRRWKNLMLGKLSILLFGADGLLLQSSIVK